MRMTVYRIEHKKNHTGPYRGYIDGRSAPMAWGMSSFTQPLPNDDGINLRTLAPRLLFERWKCGFNSVEQFTAWFDEDDRELLHEHDYHLAVFHVRSCDVLTGKKQAVFRRDAYSMSHAIDVQQITG
jgi:hypothetical protein